MVGYFFFFFKQKTAYEMRISDWSSDVCSSDLLHAHGVGEHLDVGHLADLHAVGEHPGLVVEAHGPLEVGVDHRALRLEGVLDLDAEGDAGEPGGRQREAEDDNGGYGPPGPRGGDRLAHPFTSPSGALSTALA